MIGRGNYQDSIPFLLPETLEELNKCIDQAKYGPQKICYGRAKLSKADGSLLTKSLANAKYLTHLFLVHVKLSNDHLSKIVTTLKKSKTLYHLDLTSTSLTMHSGHLLRKYIEKNKTLCILNLDNNKLGNQGATYIAQGLIYNTHLSILTIVNNKLTRNVTKPFHEALKINRVLWKLDLGIESIKLTAALQNNRSIRTVLFDKVLSKPKLSKTRTCISKITLMGDYESGKSTFLNSLIMNNENNNENIQKRMNKKNINCPKVEVTNIRTTTRLGIWEKVERHENFLFEHAMKTTHLLLIKQMREARTLHGKPDYEDDTERGFKSPRQRLDSAATGTSLHHKSGRTRSGRTDTVPDSIFSSITFIHELHKDTERSGSSGSYETSLTDEDYDTDPPFLYSSDSEDEIDLESYVRQQQQRFTDDFEVHEVIEPTSENKSFKELQQKFSRNGGRQTRVGYAASRIIRHKVGKPVNRKKKGRQGSIVRAYSFDSNRLTTMSTMGSERERRSSKTHINRGHTKFSDQKADKYMHRTFNEDVFMKIKARHEGVDLVVYELSESRNNDSMFTSIYNAFLSKPGYGPIIICFDLTKLLPSGKDESPGRKTLCYYLRLAKSKGDAKILLVGTKFDKLKKLKKLNAINSEVKKALKEAKITKILANGQSKLLFFPIDSSGNGGINDLRKKLDKVCRSLDQVKRKITLTDLCLLDYITANKFDENGVLKHTLELKEILFWAETLGLDKSRTETLLKLFMRLGLIMYFPHLKSIEGSVVFRVEDTFRSIGEIFKVDKLNSLFDSVYKSKYQDYSQQSHFANGYKRNYLISVPMVEELCGNTSDPFFVLGLLKEKGLLSHWDFDTSLFYNNIKRSHYNEDLFVMTALFNDRKEIDDFKNGPKNDILQNDDILGDSKLYEVYFEVNDRKLFTSSFFACFTSSLLSFLNKTRASTRSNRIKDYNVEIYNLRGPATLYFVINDELGFFLRGSRTGLRFYIDSDRKEGAFAAFTLAFAMIEKVKQIMGINWSFGIKLNVNGKTTSLGRLSQSKKLKDVFSDFVGEPCFKVRKGLNGIEDYLIESEL